MRMPEASIMGNGRLNRRCGGGLGQRPHEAEQKKLRFD
jgi:hypothetical protein